MTKHHTEDIEALEGAVVEVFLSECERAAAERYRPRITRLRVLIEVQLVTRHTINSAVVETELDRPPYVLGKRWADWKARRMVAAAYRRDVREQQPWVR